MVWQGTENMLPVMRARTSLVRPAGDRHSTESPPRSVTSLCQALFPHPKGYSKTTLLWPLLDTPTVANLTLDAL